MTRTSTNYRHSHKHFRSLVKRHTGKRPVPETMQECIQRRQQVRIIRLFGKIDFDPAYDYKKARIPTRRG